MKYTLIILLIIIQFSANSQQIRYLNADFKVEKTHKAVIYGNAEAINFPYLSEKFTRNKNLLLDIYQPQNDNLENRACVVLAHGGAFVTGNRKYKNIRKASEYLAQKGYVVFSIDYRKGYNPWSGKAADRAAYRGVQDMKAAIRYVKEYAETYQIDTNLVFAMGTSAGSIMSIHAAYLEENERENITATYDKVDLACLSCAGNDFKHNDKPIAVANLWGAIVDTSLIGMNNTDIPMISFHGTKDKIVSPDLKSPLRTPFYTKVSGSNILTPRLKNLGMKTHYHPFINKRHEPWGILITKPQFDTTMNKISVFFFDVLTNYIEKERAIISYVDIKFHENKKNEQSNILLINNSRSIYKVVVVNVLGEVVYKNYLNDGTIDSSLKIPINEFEKDTYYLIIQNEKETISKLFTI